uniref:hypothetical protein n=1 Tax=Agrobacterium tumefaciens TaxID=358 RepID=UPI003BA2AC06
MSSPDPRAAGRAPSGKSTSVGKPVSSTPASGEGADDASAAVAGASGLMARIGRLWDRDASFTPAQA